MPCAEESSSLFTATDLYKAWLLEIAREFQSYVKARRERRSKKEGNEDFRRELSYRKTHRAVHSVSAFISFPRICRVIAFHLYTRCLDFSCTSLYRFLSSSRFQSEGRLRRSPISFVPHIRFCHTRTRVQTHTHTNRYISRKSLFRTSVRDS